jgi:hypothetical protein
MWTSADTVVFERIGRGVSTALTMLFARARKDEPSSQHALQLE